MGTLEPQSAATWIKSLPPGSARDAGAGAFAASFAAIEPETAMLWFEQIRDPAARRAAVPTVYDTWASADAPAARA